MLICHKKLAKPYIEVKIMVILFTAFHKPLHQGNLYVKSYALYQFLVLKFFRIYSIGVEEISISLHDPNTPSSCMVKKMTTGVKTNITKSL